MNDRKLSLDKQIYTSTMMMSP